jgi:hypothetical protein
MIARTLRSPFTMMALVTAGALLAACGSSGGGNGGGGSGNATNSSSSSSGSSSSGSGGVGTGGGSSAGCVGLCTELNQCPGVTMSDCATACPDVDTFNQTSGCATKYDAEVTCILASSDKCNAATNECQGQVADYVSCASDYCNANPSTPGCP